MGICGLDEYCCNESCGICAPKDGGVCTQQICPCGNFENCASFYDGCNNCICSDIGDACTKMMCIEKGTSICNACKDKFEFDSDRNCVKSPCGGFKNCDNYNDGCNDCIC